MACTYLTNSDMGKEVANSFSSKEKLTKRRVFMKLWMSKYLSLPKMLGQSLFGDAIEILIHFGLFYLVAIYFRSSIPIKFLMLEIGSTIYPSFIEGINGSPFWKGDAIKYIFCYAFDCLMLLLGLQFKETYLISLIIEGITHSLILLILIMKRIKQKSRWKSYEFRNSCCSLTDLGIIDDSHMVLVKHNDFLEIIAINEFENEKVSISIYHSYDETNILKYYHEHKLLVVSSKVVFSLNSTREMEDIQQQQQNYAISILSVPSLNLLSSSFHCLSKNSHFILNDTDPLLSVFESDQFKNTTKIRIFDLLIYSENKQSFGLIQQFCVNEFFTQDQIKLFIQMQKVDSPIPEKEQQITNHVIKIQGATVWDIDVTNKKASEMIEHVPILNSIEKINQRIVALCGQQRIIFLDLPTKVKVRKIDCLHFSAQIKPIHNQQDGYIVLPSQDHKNKKRVYFMKNRNKYQFLCIDSLNIDFSYLYSASYWKERKILSLVVGNTLYTCRNEVFSEEQNETLDFSVCISE